mmetsp:Transcript_3831/g.10182  ORF Transcript_3831/g.10182 Transcript_3831/m.10182 type:complete len:262 (-) Transcript_3831:1675-2460(-)
MGPGAALQIEGQEGRREPRALRPEPQPRRRGHVCGRDRSRAPLQLAADDALVVHRGDCGERGGDGLPRPACCPRRADVASIPRRGGGHLHGSPRRTPRRRVRGDAHRRPVVDRPGVRVHLVGCSLLVVVAADEVPALPQDHSQHAGLRADVPGLPTGVGQTARRPWHQARGGVHALLPGRVGRERHRGVRRLEHERPGGEHQGGRARHRLRGRARSPRGLGCKLRVGPPGLVHQHPAPHAPDFVLSAPDAVLVRPAGRHRR